ncbi:MAG TPA: DinB family protein [Burkholderiales bacterium]
MVAKGESFVFGQNLEDVAEFVGLQGTGHKPLPPDQLIGKWVNVLRATQRYLRQMPTARMHERVVENRDRSIRILSHHVFRIGEAFLETAIDGVEYSITHANVPPEDGTFLTGAEIAGYGEEIIRRLQRWWDGEKDKTLAYQVKTYYGAQPMHVVFERSTWHSAQHARQLIHVLERFGIEPDGRLTTGDLAGLPLPERLFE